MFNIIRNLYTDQLQGWTQLKGYSMVWLHKIFNLTLKIQQGPNPKPAEVNGEKKEFYISVQTYSVWIQFREALLLGSWCELNTLTYH